MTEFITIEQKTALLTELKKGDKYAIKKLFNEIDRLENRIKNLEMGIEVLLEKWNEKST